ncbi:radical SAM protein [Limisalsivibrio acetivorans]|uniref:radical SAM protein n=1 Tax=Limisalsivibrio acetivorans TaxID=1304888 RepID=UPI0003B59C1B|nr:radical SAM protein [Limisalsivibrio acetivorans]
MPLPSYTQPLYRPPSEADSLIFQITEGCSYNGCAFCGMYINKPFREKPVDEVFAEIEGIPETARGRIHRVFLADGDGAVYNFDGLVRILDKLNETFPNLRRISAYAGPQALLKKKPEEWKTLRDKGLRLLYFGLESGNDEVLALMNKGMKAGKILPRIKEIQEQGIDFSIMVILGGGGRKLSAEHMRDTTAWLNEVNPKYASLLTLFLRRKKDYFDSLETPRIGDFLEEARMFVDGVRGTNIVFRSNHVSNFLMLKGILDRDRERLLAQIDSAIEDAKKRGVYEDYPDFYEEF